MMPVNKLSEIIIGMARRTRKIRQRGGAASQDFEAKTEAHLQVLDKILDKAKKGNSPLIFMMYFGAEEWCGPCQRYRPVWDEYKNTKGRTIPMIHVDHKVKEKSKHLSNIKIDGFPTNGVYSPKDGSFSAISNIHDKDSMKQLLTTEPSKLMKVNEDNDTEKTDSLVPTPTTRAKLIESGRRAVENKDTPVSEMNDPVPPNTNNDSLTKSNSSITQKTLPPAKGGSLFQALLRSVKGLGKPTRRVKRSSNRTMKN